MVPQRGHGRQSQNFEFKTVCQSEGLLNRDCDPNEGVMRRKTAILRLISKQMGKWKLI